MNLVRNIEWTVVLRAFALCVIAPWAVVYMALLWLTLPVQPLTFSQVTLGAVVVGAAYFASPLAAAYFAARAASSRPLAHAMITVALGVAVYVAFFEESAFALIIWPVMGLLGAMPFLRRPQAEA